MPTTRPNWSGRARRSRSAASSATSSPSTSCRRSSAASSTTGQPDGLTEIHPWLYGGPDGTGLNRFAHPGFLRRIIGSTFILPVLSKTAEINRLILDDAVEAHCWPANAIFQSLRATGAGRRGFTTTVGVDTFVDPRRDGGHLNASTKEELVELVTLAGEEHLFYPALPIDVAIIKASTADTEGNLTCEDEGLTQGILLQATAAHNSGGLVIAQVKRIVEAGSLHPLMVEVPGILVDHVVVHPDAHQWEYGAAEPDTPGQHGRPADAAAASRRRSRSARSR